MKISIKAESLSVWEDLNFLTEETEIEYIRVDDFLISPQTVKGLSDEFSSISTHSAINAIPGKQLNFEITSMDWWTGSDNKHWQYMDPLKKYSDTHQKFYYPYLF